jgi:uncharacterized protein (TIGR03066 family)
MAVLRVALAGWLLLAVASVGVAQKESKIDKAKLVGTWTFVKTDAKDGPPPGSVVKLEFTKDGKVNLSFTLKDKTQKASGTYTVKGDELTTVLKEPGDREKTDKVTIKELTDKKLVTVHKVAGKTETSEFKK